MLITVRVKTTLVLNRAVPDQMGRLLNDQHSHLRDDDAFFFTPLLRGGCSFPCYDILQISFRHIIKLDSLLLFKMTHIPLIHTPKYSC